MKALVLFAILLPAAAQEPGIAVTISFTEGPTVDKAGNVYFTDIRSHRILKLDTNGRLTTFRERSNAANGLLIDSQGRLVACEGGASDTGKPRVTRTDLATGQIEVLADNFQGQPFTGPNDVTTDSRGRLYFTDLTGGAVYRIDAPGKLDRILTAPEIQRPNGIQVSPDDRTLYVVESNPVEKGRRDVRAFDLSPHGTVSNPRVHYDFFPGRGADGMSIDTQGNLYLSAGLHRRRNNVETLDVKCGVYVVSPQGRLLRFHPIPEDTITNNAFGGPGMKTLYVTAGKTLFTIQTDIPGLPR
jgi:gluconolactonase